MDIESVIKMDIESIKEKYIGKVIDVKVTSTKHKFVWDEEEHEFNHYTSTDSTLDELIKEIKSLGYHDRIIYPGVAVTCDYITGRVNIYIEDGSDKLFRIASMDIG